MELNGTIKAKKTLSGTVLRSTGGGGTSDYEQLSNLPQINDVTLIGNKSSSDLGLADAADIPAPASSGTPAMDGTASRGTSSNYARADHVHPTDTSRAAATDVHSIPAGGSTGQVLKKTSGTDYAVAWANESGGGGSGPDPSTTIPLMDGNGSAGSASTYARGDHRHPADSTKADVDEVTAALAGKADKVTEATNSAAAPSLALDPEKIYHFTGTLTSLTITALTAPASGQLAHYHFDFNSGSTAPTLTLPNTVTMPSGFTVEASRHYEIDILNGYGVVMSW